MTRIAILFVTATSFAHADPLVSTARALVPSNAVSDLAIAKVERDAALDRSSASYWSFESAATPPPAAAPERSAKLDMKLTTTSIQIRIGATF